MIIYIFCSRHSSFFVSEDLLLKYGDSICVYNASTLSKCIVTKIEQLQ